jgi:translation initiation factor 2A
LIKISPDSNVLCIAGFGSLKGDVDFYRLVDYALIGRTNFYCCVTLNWSADSKFLLGAVLSTRVKVDNEYRVLLYNGEELVREQFKGEIYDCQWVRDDGKIYKIEFSFLI